MLHYYYINEYEKLPLPELESRLESLQNNIPNLHILNCNSILINNLCIAGCTLWTKPECKIPKFIVKIPEFNNTNYFNQHKTHLKYISKIMKYCKDKDHELLMVTHHPPTYDVLKDTKKRKKFVSLYSTNLDYLLDKKFVRNWICGHTHHNFDFYSKKGCRILSNQMGKSKDNINNYNNSFVLNF